METTAVKTCTKCLEAKSLECFNKHSRDKTKYQSWCRTCKNKLENNWYYQNKDKRVKQVYDRITTNKIKAIEYLGGKCVDCLGIFPSYVYDFHHVEPSTKETELTKARFRSWDNYKKELDKCVLLCANCHRIRHYGFEEKKIRSGHLPSSIHPVG